MDEWTVYRLTDAGIARLAKGAAISDDQGA